MFTDRVTYVAHAGDVLVPLPHTLTLATRAAFDARARAVIPSPAGPSARAAEPRLVLDARDCAVIDDAGLATVRAVRRAAAAAGVDVLVVDAPPALAGWLTMGRDLPMSLAFRPDEETDEAQDDEVPNDPPEPGVLALNDAARARLAARQRHAGRRHR